MVAYLVEIVNEPLQVIVSEGCHTLVVLLPGVKYAVGFLVKVGEGTRRGCGFGAGVCGRG